MVLNRSAQQRGAHHVNRWIFSFVRYERERGFRQSTLLIRDMDADPAAFLDLLDDAREQHYDLHPDGAIVYWTATPEKLSRAPRCRECAWLTMGTVAVVCMGCCRVRKLMTDTKGKQ